MRREPLVIASMLAAIVFLNRPVEAQRGNPPAPPPPKAGAPIDLTGYWVSIVTQDWRWRMVTPAKGDYQGIQLTPAARKIADAWDPAKDEAAGEQCKSYGAPALMSVPGRFHITWQDDTTLKVESDAGTQTRLLSFALPQAQGAPSLSRGGNVQTPLDSARDKPADAPRTFQGVSQAQWLMPRPNVPLQLRPADRAADTPAVRPAGGSLQVVTRNLRAGYLRKNGVPYSDRATFTEYFNRLPKTGDLDLLLVTTIVEDPVYLSQPFYTSTHFKREADGSKWSPTPCHTDPPPK